MKKLKVFLKAFVNPDFANQGFIKKIKPKSISVNSLSEAKKVTQEFIDEYDLGSGNFHRAPVYEGSKQIASISYNGRIWDMNDNEIEINGLKNKKTMATKKKANPILKKIVAEAKRIQKAHPAMKWTNAIKDAAKHIKSGAKTIVKKASTAKKKAVSIKKTAKKRVKYAKSAIKNTKKAFGINGLSKKYDAIGSYFKDHADKLKYAMQLKASYISSIEWNKEMAKKDKTRKNVYLVNAKIEKDKLKKINLIISKLKKGL